MSRQPLFTISKVFALLILSGCAGNTTNSVSKSFNNKILSLAVIIKDQDPENKFLYAGMKVKNISADTINYTNAGVLAITLNDTGRAYWDQQASWIGDYGSVKIPPNDSLQLDIYFAMKSNLTESDIQNINIVYQHPDSPVYH